MLTKKKLTEILHIRVSEIEKNRIKFLAEKFANGNISLWVTYCALNAPREKLDHEHLKESTRKKTKPPIKGACKNG